MSVSEIWYHGTNNKLPSDMNSLVFDRKRGEEQNQEGPGFYLTSSLDEAIGYGSNVYDVRFSGNILVSGSKSSKTAVLAQLLKMYKTAPAHCKVQFLGNFGFESIRSEAAVRKVLYENYCDNDLHTAMVLLYHDLFNYDSQEYIKAARLITDAILVEDGTRSHLVVLNPNKLTMKKLPA